MWGNPSSKVHLESDNVPVLGNTDCGFELEDTSLDHGSLLGTPLSANSPDPSSSGSSSSKDLVGDYTEGNDFSDDILKYINQVLMDDDLEDKVGFIQDSALHDTEKSFSDILTDSDINSSDAKYTITNSRSNYSDNRRWDANKLTQSGLNHNLSDYTLSHGQNSPMDHNFLSVSYSICPPSSTFENVNGLMSFAADEPGQIQPVLNLQDTGEIGDPTLFNASGNCEIFHPDNIQLCPLDFGNGFSEMGEKKEDGILTNGFERGKKKFYPEDESEEERSKKRSMACTLETVLLEMLDTMMIGDGGNDESTLSNYDESCLEAQQYEQSKVSNGENGSIKKRGSKRGMVDVRSLLIQCGQAIASNDHRSANELLRQIRWHSSPSGNKFQRMSHYFADSFDARLVGTGHVSYTALKAKNRANINSLKARNHFVSVIPFTKISFFLSTQMIMEQAEKASTLHIVDFDILHGLQLVPVIQLLSKRAGGPPNLRITGIGYPEPGCQPAATVEKTGRRLANYCERLGVPFEYNCIAKEYENIHTGDFHIEKDEVLVVYSFYLFIYLLDDSTSEDSPRDAILKLIRRLSPDIFIHATVNGAYNSPYLVSRFREAVFHFSALFDMFEANLPKDDPERILFEQEVFGLEILNVLACEGSDRIVRPETYKQWHVRHLRAGFCQVPLNQKHMKKARAMIQSNYHKDFLLDEQGQWMVQGWKGRVLYALSFWKPA